MKMSRRGFLEGAAKVATLTTVTGILGPVANVYIRDKFTSEKSLQEVKEAKERIQKRHQVIVTVDVPKSLKLGGKTVNVSPNESVYIQMCAILEFEKLLNYYPPDILGNFVPSVCIGSFPYDTHAAGFMTPDGRSIAIHLDSIFSSYRSLFGTLISPRASHHEIGHALTKEHIFVREVTAGFEKLNPEQAYLGHILRELYPGEKLNELVPGFVRAYGMTSVAEDIAEIIALLFRGQDAVNRRLEKDDELAPPGHKWHGVLRSKITRVKQIVRGKIHQIDEQFWLDVGTSRLQDGIAYWNGRRVFQKSL